MNGTDFVVDGGMTKVNCPTDYSMLPGWKGFANSVVSRPMLRQKDQRRSRQLVSRGKGR